MTRSIISMTALAFLAVVGYQFIASTEAPATPVSKNEGSELAFLTCEDAESVQAILTSLDEDGTEAALVTTSQKVNVGDCYYVENFSFARSDIYGPSPEGETKFDMVSCQEISTGQCIAVQPVSYQGSKVSEVGYALVVHPEQEATLPTIKVTDLEKTILFDLN